MILNITTIFLGSIASLMTIYTFIQDKIKGNQYFTTIKSILAKLKKSKNITQIDKSTYSIKSPQKGEDDIKFSFTDGTGIGFSLQEVKRNHTNRNDFINEMLKTNNNFIENKSVTKSDLMKILNIVWEKSKKI